MDAFREFRTTQYAGEWVLERPEGIVVVRQAGPYARCWRGSGGEPVDIHTDTLEGAFRAGLDFANGLRSAA